MLKDLNSVIHLVSQYFPSTYGYVALTLPSKKELSVGKTYCNIDRQAKNQGNKDAQPFLWESGY